jgi:hypothetical protein
MGAFMEAINYNSVAYMIFMLGIVGAIYLILFMVVKFNLKK